MISTCTLKAENLCKSFGDFKAVNNLSLDVFQGEVFGLLGPNGAGKTTSIKMLTGLLEADSGNILIGGMPATNGKSRFNTGLCPQELVLWNNLTCMEQLTFMASMYNVPYKIARKRASELLEKMGLEAKKNKLVKTLSGGMQRRMNILMALMHDPSILILDEPEAGLDPQSRVMVREFIASLASQKTIIFTTHNMDEADRICNRIGIIDHGKMLVVGSPESLKQQFGAGDKLEINISGNIPSPSIFSDLAVEITILDQVIYFKSGAIIQKIPVILERIGSAGVTISGIRLSENTLEDVFISLTGRKLRD